MKKLVFLRFGTLPKGTQLANSKGILGCQDAYQLEHERRNIQPKLHDICD